MSGIFQQFLGWFNSHRAELKGDTGDTGPRSAILLGDGVPSATPPSELDIYIDEATGFMYHRNSGAWVSSSPRSIKGSDSTTPVGSISCYGGSTPPEGWLLCDGTEYDSTDITYTGLFDIIGTLYGSSGGDMFNVPDMRERFPLGLATSHPVIGAVLGETGGTPDHTHTTSAPSGSYEFGVTIGVGGPVSTNAHIHDTSGENPPYLTVNFIIKL